MKALKLNDSQLESIFFKDSERFEFIKSDGWEQDGKYQFCTFVFKDTTSGLIYQGSVSRSGSPFTEWSYNSDLVNDDYVLNPVEEIQITVTKYQEVSDDKISEIEEVTKL